LGSVGCRRRRGEDEDSYLIGCFEKLQHSNIDSDHPRLLTVKQKKQSLVYTIYAFKLASRCVSVSTKSFVYHDHVRECNFRSRSSIISSKSSSWVSAGTPDLCGYIASQVENESGGMNRIPFSDCGLSALLTAQF
jgi:hypothetical protein